MIIPKTDPAISSTPADFKRISIPLIRRIYPQLIESKIVLTQPLMSPNGLVPNGKIIPRSIDSPWLDNEEEK